MLPIWPSHWPALDAVLELRRAGGAQRLVPITEFYRLPGSAPHIETVLEPGEMITAVTVPAGAAARNSHYLKVRDRASFEFALVSVAVALGVRDGTVSDARLAAGGVGTRPWRLPEVEFGTARQARGRCHLARHIGPVG